MLLEHFKPLNVSTMFTKLPTIFQQLLAMSQKRETTSKKVKFFPDSYEENDVPQGNIPKKSKMCCHNCEEFKCYIQGLFQQQTGNIVI